MVTSDPISLTAMTVRPVDSKEEEARWDQEMAAHHYLGFRRLTGETLQHVALHGETWVALVGWGSAAFRSGHRDRYLEWPPEVRIPRLRYIANNQRFLILPEFRIKNLASRVLALSCRRLPEDYLRVFGHRVVLAETFVDPSRFAGTCYWAAGWHPLGATRGFGYHSGVYRHHGAPKILWVRPLIRDGEKMLSAPVLSPRLHGKEFRVPCNLNALPLAEGSHSLRDALSRLADPRKRRGIRHSQVSVLLVAIAAMISGSLSFRAMGEWVKTLPQDLLERLGCRRHPDSLLFIPPSEPTLRRTVGSVDPEEFSQAVGQWFLDQTLLPEDAISVDGKTLRGSRTPTRKAIHLLSAFLPSVRATLAQIPVPDKTNEIPKLKEYNGWHNLDKKTGGFCRVTTEPYDAAVPSEPDMRLSNSSGSNPHKPPVTGAGYAFQPWWLCR